MELFAIFQCRFFLFSFFPPFLFFFSRNEERANRVSIRKVLNLRAANCSCQGNFIPWSGNARPRIKSPATHPSPSFSLIHGLSSSPPFVDRKWNGCFALNLLRDREFLRSPISPYFAFIIVISIHPMPRPIFHPPPHR